MTGRIRNQRASATRQPPHTRLMQNPVDGLCCSSMINDYDRIAPVFDVAIGADFNRLLYESIRNEMAKNLRFTKNLRHLDLCCGTGDFLCRINNEFASEAHGIDWSPGLVRLARKRARRTGQKLVLARGDVLTTSFPQECHLVTMNFDALNHLKQLGNWEALFKRVHKSLRRDGIFMFDVNSPKALRAWDVPTVIVRPQFTYLQIGLDGQAGHQSFRRQLLVEIFDKSTSHSTAYSMILEELAISFSLLTKLLRSSGFTSVHRWKPPKAAIRRNVFFNHRWFCIAR